MLIFILKKHSAELQRIQTERSVILVIARLLISAIVLHIESFRSWFERHHQIYI